MIVTFISEYIELLICVYDFNNIKGFKLVIKSGYNFF